MMRTSGEFYIILKDMQKKYPLSLIREHKRAQAAALFDDIHQNYLYAMDTKKTMAQRINLINDYVRLQDIFTKLAQKEITMDKAHGEINLLLQKEQQLLFTHNLLTTTKLALGLSAALASGSFLYLLVGVAAAPPVFLVFATSLVLLHAIMGVVQTLSEYIPLTGIRAQKGNYEKALNFFASADDAREELSLNQEPADLVQGITI